MPSDARFITDNNAPGTPFAYATWEAKDGAAPRVVSFHAALAANGSRRRRMKTETSCRVRCGFNASRYAVLDRQGSPLWKGARVRIRAIDQGHIPFEAAATVVGVDEWNQVQLDLDTPRQAFRLIPGTRIVVSDGMTQAFTFPWAEFAAPCADAPKAILLRSPGTSMVLDVLESCPYWLELQDDPRKVKAKAA